jgi:hypothetical protein
MWQSRMVSLSHGALPKWCHAVMVHSQNSIINVEMQSYGKVRMVPYSHGAQSEWCYAVIAHIKNGVMQYCRSVSCSHVAKSNGVLQSLCIVRIV